MNWREAVDESREGLAILVLKKIRWEQTYVVDRFGHCQTHPMNRPTNLMEGPIETFSCAHSDDWEPAECCGFLYSEDIEKGLLPLEVEARLKAEEYIRKEEQKTLNSDMINVEKEGTSLELDRLKLMRRVKKERSIYDDLREIDRLLEGD